LPRSEKGETHSSISKTRVVQHETTVDFTRPIVIGGFVGPGLVGLTTAGYIIESMGLHEVAYVSSPYVPPSVVFIGGKVRHPFRIYRDKTGTVSLVICEVKIDRLGLYDTAFELLNWFQKFNPTEVVVLDAVPLTGLPEARPTFFIAGDKRKEELKALGILPAESVLVGGVAGSILSECLIRKIPSISLLTPVSITVPDPNAPLNLIKALNAVYGFKIATKELEEDVAAVNQELEEIAKQYRRVQEEASTEAKGTETMYG